MSLRDPNRKPTYPGAIMRFIGILNLAIPIAFAIGLLFSFFIYAPIAKLFMLAGASEAFSQVLSGWLTLALVLGVAIAIVRFKARSFAIPTRKFILGHSVLAVGNLTAIAVTVFPLVIGHITGNTEYGLYMWYSLPVLFANLLIWPLGWGLATSQEQDA